MSEVLWHLEAMFKCNPVLRQTDQSVVISSNSYRPQVGLEEDYFVKAQRHYDSITLRLPS